MISISLATALQWAGLITAFFACLMSVMIFVVTKNKSRSNYDADLNRAMLSEMRSAYDHKLAQLSSQLMATEGRWRETNHLLISGQNHQKIEPNSTKSPQSRFITNLGIDQNKIEVDDNLVFFLTPFTAEEHRLYVRVQRVCNMNGLKCVRGDETQASGEILPHIVRLMLEAKIVIANITSRNPNVFYELGLAHALDKPTILIASTLEDVPFDVQSKRTIIYNDFKELEMKLTRAFVHMFRNEHVEE